MRLAATAALALVTSAVPALDHELRLGPQELVVGASLLSQQVELGAVRFEEPVIALAGNGRFMGFGLGVRSWTSIGDDDRRDIDAGEFTEVQAQVDYLFEIQDLLQVIPHYRFATYPAYDGAEDAHWVGADVWWLTPLEGVEVGASVDVDAGDTYGWYGGVGAREFIQGSGIDLALWQLLHFGNRDFHQYFTTGADVSGVSAVSLGAQVTVPLPWENAWVDGLLAVDWWLQGDDRDALEDAAELTIGFGATFRL